MPRLARVQRTDCSPEDQKIHDLVVGDIGHDPAFPAGNRDGIYQVMMVSPETAKRWHHLGRWLRRGALTRDSDFGRGTKEGPQNVIPAKLVEMIMCVVARDTNCQRLWHTHVGAARDLGLSAASVEILAGGGSLEGLQQDELHVAEYCREMVRTHTVSDKTFARVREQLGDRGVMELTALAGWWIGFCVLTNAMKMTLPEAALMEGEPLLKVPPQYECPPCPPELDRGISKEKVTYQDRGRPTTVAG